MSEETAPPIPSACSGFVDLRTDSERAEDANRDKAKLRVINSLRSDGWAIVQSQYEEFEILSTFKTKKAAEKTLERADKSLGFSTGCYIKKIGSWR